jgi:TonB family protein
MSAQTVEELLAERRHIDPPISGGAAVSVALHVLVAAAILIVPALIPKPKHIIPIGIAVPVAPGGRGVSDPAPPAPTKGPERVAEAPPAPPVTAAPAPPVTAPPAKVTKPPQETKKGIPELRDKPSRTKPTPPPAQPRAGTGTKAGGRGSEAAGVTPAATGRNPQPAGIEMAPDGEGVPWGTDLNADWYLTSVQRKVWMVWLQQPKPEFVQPVIISFTIMADGSATNFRILESSGNKQVDFAAQRAVASASPFSPLPRHYGTNQYTIQARFHYTAR